MLQTLLASQPVMPPDAGDLIGRALAGQLAWMLVGTAAALLLVGRLLWRVGQHSRRPGATWRQRLSSERGTATIEFVLVLPVLIVLVLLLIQTMLMMVGNLFVHYAAFAAARTAITQIPRDLSEEGGTARNFMVAEPGDEKFDNILMAAARALMPVSGMRSGNSAEASDLRSGLQDYYRAYDVETPSWVDRLAPGRMDYAIDFTWVRIHKIDFDSDEIIFDNIEELGETEFSPKEPVGVEVVHRLHLSVPYVGVIFADGTHSTAEGEAGYADIVASCILGNEGFHTELPEPPPIPRRP